MTVAFFFGFVCGASIVGLIALGIVGGLKDDIAELQIALSLERQNTIHQVNNVLEVADSIEAQADRERYRREIAMPDWEQLFAKVRGTK